MYGCCATVYSGSISEGKLLINYSIMIGVFLVLPLSVSSPSSSISSVANPAGPSLLTGASGVFVFIGTRPFKFGAHTYTPHRSIL